MKATATEVKTRFGRYLTLVRHGNIVIIERSGEELAALIDYAEYQRLKYLEEQLLIEKIKQAEQGGYLSQQESKALLRKMISRLVDEPETSH